MGALDLKAFWARRCRRLLPALLVVVTAVSAYAAVLAARDELNSLRTDALASLGYVANWRAIAVGSNYGDLFSAPSPLQHTWSLGIEEQWYLLWPVALLGLLWVGRRFSAVPLMAVGAMAVASTALMAVLYDPGNLGRAYYGTDTRCQSLLVGAGLALLVDRVRVGSWAAVASVAALAWLWATTPLGAPWLYHGGFLVCALLVALVIASTTRPGPVRAALSMRPLPEIGLISYGLYLWHWPVYVVLSSQRTDLDGWPLLAVRLVVTAMLATVSYVAIERPVRSGTFRVPRPAMSVPALVGAVAALALVVTRGGQPSVVFAVPYERPPVSLRANASRQSGERQENQPSQPDPVRGRRRFCRARHGRGTYARRSLVRPRRSGIRA